MVTLAYVGSHKSPHFINLLPKGSGFSITAEPKYPIFRSNNGFSMWCKHVEKAFRVSPSRAALMAFFGTEGREVQWVLDLSETVVRKTTIPGIGSPRWVVMEQWLRNYSNAMTFEFFFYNRIAAEKGFPVNLIRAVKEHGLDIYDRPLMSADQRAAIKAAKDPLGSYLGTKAATVLRRFGSKAYQVFDKLSDEAKDRADLSFIPGDHSDISVRMFGQMGVKPTELFPSLTRAEAISLFNLVKSQIAGPNSVSLIKEIEFRYPKAPFYITAYCNSMAVADWAMAHIAKLDGHRILHGPAGQTVRFEYHTILRSLTADDLPQGTKTGWERMLRTVEARMHNELMAQLGENVELPLCPLDLESVDERIFQLTSTHELRDEGVDMEHCVGSYAQFCLQEKSYIFHVDDGSEKGATVEVGKSAITFKWQIFQAMGPKNAHSKAAERIVLDALSVATKGA